MLVLGLLGVGAVYVIGRELAGRAGAFAAAALLVAAPPFAADAARVEADVPSIALALVALAIAVRWLRSGAVWGPASAGAIAAAAISVKLLALPVLVPLGVLAWQRRVGARGVLFLLCGGLLVGAVFAIAYAHVLSDLWRDGVSFHRAARSVAGGQSTSRRIFDYFGARTPTTWAAAAGISAAIVFRRQLALWLWVVAALLFLAFQAPLLDHHFVLLAAALGTAAGTSLGAVPGRFATVALAGACLLAVAGWVQDYRQIDRSTQPEAADVTRAAAIVKTLTRPDQLVASDLPIVPYLAGRREPGSLVDTSAVRFAGGSLKAIDVRDTPARVYVAGREFLRYPATISGLSLVDRIGGIKILVRR